jgi:hypothetical protein
MKGRKRKNQKKWEWEIRMLKEEKEIKGYIKEWDKEEEEEKENKKRMKRRQLNNGLRWKNEEKCVLDIRVEEKQP